MIRLEIPAFHQLEDAVLSAPRLGSVHLPSLLQGLDHSPGGQKIVRLQQGQRCGEFVHLRLRRPDHAPGVLEKRADFGLWSVALKRVATASRRGYVATKSTAKAPLQSDPE